MKEVVCATCYERGWPKTRTKGSFMLELFLWILFLLPGLIYSIWRLTSRHKACYSCGSAAIVPPDSPRGQQIRRKAEKILTGRS